MNRLFVAAISIVLLLGFGSAPRANASLIGHWVFDEVSGGIAIDSIGGNNGAVLKATRILGRRGSGALHFNGFGDRVVVGGIGTGLELLNTAYSISFWMRAGGDTGSQYQTLMVMEDGADYTGGYSLHLNQGLLQMTP